MPNIFMELALEAGDSVFVDGNLIGGYSLGVPGFGHLHNATSISMIERGYWDYVILQEHSQMPTIPFYRDNYTFPAADSLNAIIQQSNNCAHTVFFMTWGRKYGGQQCINSYCSPVFTDYFHMQDSLETAYMYMTLSNQAMCAPVGISWSNSIANGDPIELFDTDATHPSLAGSYLAACTFYAAIFQKSPLGINYYAGLSVADGVYLQQIAETAVLTNPEQWNIFPPETLTASFTYELNDKLASFSNTSVNTSVYAWDFGEPLSGSQNTSVLEDPTHQYSGPGTYFVSLEAGDGCQSSMAFDTLVILETVIPSHNEFYLKVFPNPVRDNISIKTDHVQQFHRYEVSGLQGSKYLSGDVNTSNGFAQIYGLSALSPGIYFLVLIGDEIQLSRKFVVLP